MNINELFCIAEENGINIYDFGFDELESMSVPGNIAIDTRKIDTTAELKDKLSHELGHCMTGSFYNINNPFDLKEKKEYIADSWKREHIMPFSEFVKAISSGITEVWQIAEYFETSYEFAEKAATYYKDNYDLSEYIEYNNA